MKKFTKELKQINNFLESAKEILKNNVHGDRPNQYITVNVKRYNDYVDVEALINNMAISEVKKIFLKEEFTEEKINNIWEFWLEYERRYFCDDVMTGCRNGGSNYWDDVIELVKEGGKTSYPDIEKLKTKETRIKRLEQWQDKDKKELQYLSLLNNKLEGFFGRSGGWLGIKEVSILQNGIDEIEQLLDYINSGKYEDAVIEEDIDHCLHYVDMDLINALNWIIEEINDFNKGLKFEDEIKFRIDEILENNPFIEDVSTVYYAIN